MHSMSPEYGHIIVERTHFEPEVIEVSERREREYMFFGRVVFDRGAEGVEASVFPKSGELHVIRIIRELGGEDRDIKEIVPENGNTIVRKAELPSTVTNPHYPDVSLRITFSGEEPPDANVGSFPSDPKPTLSTAVSKEQPRD